MERGKTPWILLGRLHQITREMFNSGLTTKNPPFSQLFNLLRLHFDRCTFVKDYNNFWTQVPATGMVRVGRAAAPVTPAYQAPTTYSRDQASYPYVPPVSTTTTRIVSTSTVASTTPWSFSKPVLKEGPLFAPAIIANTWLIFFQTPAPTASAQLPSVYTGCGDTKGCFSLSGSACIKDGSCTALVTYAIKGQRYEFELWAPNSPPNSYVAVGFSDDQQMGDDSVTECSLLNGRVNAHMSYNEKNDKRNTRLRDV